VTFRYTYRTSDGAWHEAEIEASDRNAVYDTLKPQGIRPVKVWCPNPPLFHGAKRWIAIVILALVAVGTSVVAYRRSAHNSSPFTLNSSLAPVPRHRILNAPPDFAAQAVKHFAYSSERFLALNAQPGLPYSVENESLDDLAEALEHEIVPSPDEPEWVVDMKRIVAGMKIEAGILMRDGKKPSDIELWLTERQKMESTYRNQIIGGPGTLDEKAAKLRMMGL
jgi:hypothetical protein